VCLASASKNLSISASRSTSSKRHSRRALSLKGRRLPRTCVAESWALSADATPAVSAEAWREITSVLPAFFPKGPSEAPLWVLSSCRAGLIWRIGEVERKKLVFLTVTFLRVVFLRVAFWTVACTQRGLSRVAWFLAMPRLLSVFMTALTVPREAFTNLPFLPRLPNRLPICQGIVGWLPRACRKSGLAKQQR
jgi:hypothetical protein